MLTFAEFNAQVMAEPRICDLLDPLAANHGWIALVASWCAWRGHQGCQLDERDAAVASEAVQRMERDILSKLTGAMVAAQALSHDPFQRDAGPLPGLIQTALDGARQAQVSAIVGLGVTGRSKPGDDQEQLIAANLAAYSIFTRSLAQSREPRRLLAQAIAAAARMAQADVSDADVL